MDNASRALIMAGGMLIAIAIISTALYAVTKGRGYANASEELLNASQIQSFNRFYTAYNSIGASPKEIDCIDGINILNRALDDELDDDNVIENSSKITDIGGVYTVPGDHTEYYVQKVKVSFGADAEGRVNLVKIED